MDIDPNIVPDNIAKARAMVQLLRCSLGSQAPMPDDALDAILWTVEDLLTEAGDIRLSLELARETCAGPPATG